MVWWAGERILFFPRNKQLGRKAAKVHWCCRRLYLKMPLCLKVYGSFLYTSCKTFWTPLVAFTLQNEGCSYCQIADKIGHCMTASGIRKLCVRFDESGSIKTKDGRGKKKATTYKTDRKISRLVLQNRRATSCEINILSDTGVKMSDRTVRPRLVAAGLKAQIPPPPQKKKTIPQYSAEDKATAVGKRTCIVDTWAMKQSHMERQNSISIFGSDDVYYVHCRPGEAWLPECLTPTMKHPVTVMIWGCMSWSGAA